MMTAEKLGMRELYHRTFLVVLAMLERGDVSHVRDNVETPLTIDLSGGGRWTGHFNMNVWRGKFRRGGRGECDTVCCIGGMAELVGGFYFDVADKFRTFEALFYPQFPDDSVPDYNAITVEQAARALRNYLETGHPSWQEVLR